jgi:hypothetical protein
MTLDLPGSAIEEEPQLDHHLLALGELCHDLAQGDAVHAGSHVLIDRGLSRGVLRSPLLGFERDGATAPCPLALVEGLVEGGLGEVGAHLLLVHLPQRGVPPASLLEEDDVGVVEDPLAIGGIEPAATPTEHPQDITTVTLVGDPLGRALLDS